VKEGETSAEATSSMMLSDLETTLLLKIQEIERRIREEKDVEQLQKLSDTLNMLLENLEKARRTKKR